MPHRYRPSATRSRISTAVRDTNPEVVEARRRGIPVLSRADALASRRRDAARERSRSSGTHGKTTTTSCSRPILRAAGLAPELPHRRHRDGSRHATRRSTPATGSSSRPTRATAPSSSSPPRCRVVTNVEPDHLDRWGTFDGPRGRLRGRSSRSRPGPACSAPTLRSRRASPRGMPSVTYGFDAAARDTGRPTTGRRPAAPRSTSPSTARTRRDDRAARCAAGTTRSTRPVPPRSRSSSACRSPPWSTVSPGFRRHGAAGSSTGAMRERRRLATTTTRTPRARSRRRWRWRAKVARTSRRRGVPAASLHAHLPALGGVRRRRSSTPTWSWSPASTARPKIRSRGSRAGSSCSGVLDRHPETVLVVPPRVGSAARRSLALRVARRPRRDARLRRHHPHSRRVDRRGPCEGGRGVNVHRDALAARSTGSTRGCPVACAARCRVGEFTTYRVGWTVRRGRRAPATTPLSTRSRGWSRRSTCRCSSSGGARTCSSPTRVRRHRDRAR